MAVFTTWAAAKTQILNDFLSRDTTIAEYTIGGNTFKARNIAEFKELLELCDMMTAADVGDMDTYAQFDKPRGGL